MQHNYTDISYHPSIFTEIPHLKPLLKGGKIQWVSSWGDGEDIPLFLSTSNFLSSTEIMPSGNGISSDFKLNLLQQKLQNKPYVNLNKASHISLQVPFSFSLNIYAIWFHWDTKGIYSY